MVLKEVLSNRIDQLGWSIETTAKRTGLHRQLIGKLLRGETKDPRMKTLKILAEKLDISIDTMAGVQKNREKNHDEV